MSRYFTTILFVAESDAPDYKPLYEETFLIIRASGESDAEQRARKFAARSEHGYKSVTGNNIKWRFVEVVDVSLCVDEDLDKDIVELHGRFLRDIDSFNKLRSIED